MANTFLSNIFELEDDDIVKNEKYLDKMKSLFEERKLNIYNDYSDLNIKIEGLDEKIKSILTKHHNDYLKVFNEFMDTVRKDIKEKIERMEQIEKEKRKNENIHLVMAERDFFRQEAIRLNQLCKDLSYSLDLVNREMRDKISEYENIKKKWKEAENSNKQLVAELNKNVLMNRELEDINRQLYEKKNTEMVAAFEHIPTEFKEEKNKDNLIYSVVRLQKELNKQRKNCCKAESNLNKIILEKNNLEKIFIDCIEETKKDILHRKLNMEKMAMTTLSGFKLKKNIPPIINEIKYDNFLPTDKRRLIESYILNDEVINFIKEHVFKKLNLNNDRNDFNLTYNSFKKGDRKLITVSSNKRSSSSQYRI